MNDDSLLLAIFAQIFHGAVAQLVEQRPLKATVPGSTPGCPTMNRLLTEIKNENKELCFNFGEFVAELGCFHGDNGTFAQFTCYGRGAF